MIKWNFILSFWATVFIPLLYFENIYIAYKTPDTFKAPVILVLIGILVAILGLLFWILSYISLGKSFGVLPQKQKRIKKGLYRYFNHPMYIGIFTTFLGLSLANKSWQSLVFLNLIIVPLLFIRAYFEDKKLTD